MTEQIAQLEVGDRFVIGDSGHIASVDGGAGGFDTISVSSGASGSVVSVITGPQSGIVTRDGLITTYAGLEPVDVSSCTTCEVTAGDGGHDIRIRMQGGEVWVEFTDGSGETHRIAAAAALSLTVRGGAGNDRISVGNSSSKVDGDIDYYSATGALYYDTPTLFSLYPYVGAGAGVVHQRNERNAVTIGGRSFPAGSRSTDLTAFGEAGLNIDLGNALELVPSYRYQWIDDGKDGFDDSGIHVARLGLRYWFN